MLGDFKTFTTHNYSIRMFSQKKIAILMFSSHIWHSVQIIVSEAASESVSISKPWRSIKVFSFCQRYSTWSSLPLSWRDHRMRKMEKSVWSIIQNKIWCVSQWVNEAGMYITCMSIVLSLSCKVNFTIDCFACGFWFGTDINVNIVSECQYVS